VTRPDMQSFVPGYRIRYVELDNACAFLVGQGWAGGVGFDEAVKAAHGHVSKDHVDWRGVARDLYAFVSGVMAATRATPEESAKAAADLFDEAVARNTSGKLRRP
jgi:hypothetical protein